MAIPDFSQKTVDILGRRARFQCSNPDCRVQTIGPNSNPDKATTIGEAAHIHGAKPKSMRYDSTMSDVTRASITNGIWLCRNCHGKIDRDAVIYPADLLFAWRKAHEDRILQELGTPGDRIRSDVEMTHLEFLAGYPALIQRIVIDKPDGWEWRFVAELMQHLNKPHFKRLKNLRLGHYYNPQPSVHSDDFFGWVQERTHVMSKLIGPLTKLIDRLTESWRELGESCNVEEMHEVCILIRDMLAAMVDHEEVLLFTYVPEEGEELRAILVDAVGSNADKLDDIPMKLDEIVALIDTDHGGTEENPHTIKWTLTFDLPDDFNERFDEALLNYGRTLQGK